MVSQDSFKRDPKRLVDCDSIYQPQNCSTQVAYSTVESELGECNLSYQHPAFYQSADGIVPVWAKPPCVILWVLLQSEMNTEAEVVLNPSTSFATHAHFEEATSRTWLTVLYISSVFSPSLASWHSMKAKRSLFYSIFSCHPQMNFLRAKSWKPRPSLAWCRPGAIAGQQNWRSVALPDL